MAVPSDAAIARSLSLPLASVQAGFGDGVHCATAVAVDAESRERRREVPLLDEAHRAVRGGHGARGLLGGRVVGHEFEPVVAPEQLARRRDPLSPDPPRDLPRVALVVEDEQVAAELHHRRIELGARGSSEISTPLCGKTSAPAAVSCWTLPGRSCRRSRTTRATRRRVRPTASRACRRSGARRRRRPTTGAVPHWATPLASNRCAHRCRGAENGVVSRIQERMNAPLYAGAMPTKPGSSLPVPTYSAPRPGRSSGRAGPPSGTRCARRARDAPVPREHERRVAHLRHHGVRLEFVVPGENDPVRTPERSYRPGRSGTRRRPDRRRPRSSVNTRTASPL